MPLADADSDLGHGLLLFGHLTGVLLYVGGLAVYMIVLERLRHVTSPFQVRALLDGPTWGVRASLTGIALILAGGLAMAGRQELFGHAWVIWSLVAFVALGLLGRLTVDGRVAKMRAMSKDADSSTSNDALLAAAGDPVMLAGCRSMAVLTLSILFLVAVQPSAVGSAITVAASAVLVAANHWKG